MSAERDALKAALARSRGARLRAALFARMFLMFHELRADILPVDDIGLQRAVARHYNGGARMPAPALRKLARAWQPYRSVATWYLWRSLDPIPVEY